MFNCQLCGVTSALPPNFVVTRSEPVEYLYKDIEGNPRMSVGSQIVTERRWCHRCAEVPVHTDRDQGAYDVNIRGARAAFSHTQRCNKKAEDCKLCEQIQKFFSLLPLHHLSDAMAEPAPQEATFSLATLIMESTFERGTHRSARGLRDKAAGMSLLRYYEKELGGKLSPTSH